MLAGGHPNSLGRTVEVVDLVLADRTRMRELYECYRNDDEVVRLRVSNALKRVTCEHPEWTYDFIEGLHGEVAEIDQASTKWTLALLFDAMRDLLDDKQSRRAVEVMQRNLATSNDWIVLTTTMKVLGSWAHDDPVLAAWLRPHAERLRDDPRRSVASQARRLAESLVD